MHPIILIILAVIVLSILVLVHEFGHFIAAKLVGVWPEEFGIGLPPRAWGKKIGETIYSVNWLPLGGFVRLHGESADAKVTKPERAFVNASRAKRAFVALAGIVMNFAFAWVCFSLMFLITGIPKGVRVLYVETESPASVAQIKPGDEIYRFDNAELIGTEEYILNTKSAKGKKVNLSYKNGDVKQVDFLTEPLSYTVLVSEVVQNSHAANGGILEGDIIKTINGSGFLSANDFQSVIKDNRGKQIVMGIMRGDELVDLSIDVRQEAPEGQGLTGITFQSGGSYDGLSGIMYGIEPVEVERPSPLNVIYYGARETVKWTKFTVEALVTIFTDLGGGKVPQGLAGPFGVTLTIAEVIRYGIVALLSFTGIISVNLALVNVIPFPPLDGSRVVLLGVEALVGKKNVQKIEGKLLNAGMAILLLLIVLLTISEIPKLISAGSISGFVESLFVE